MLPGNSCQGPNPLNRPLSRPPPNYLKGLAIRLLVSSIPKASWWRNLMDSCALPGSPGIRKRTSPLAGPRRANGRGGRRSGACGRTGGGGARAGAPAWPAPPRSRSAGGRRQRSGPSVRRSVGLPGPALPPGAARLHGPRRRREVVPEPRGPLTGRWGRAMGERAVHSCWSWDPYPSWSGAPC